MRARVLRNLYPSNIEGFYDINKLSGQIFNVYSFDDNGNITIILNGEEMVICKGEYEIISLRRELESYMIQYPLKYNLCCGNNMISFMIEHREDLVKILQY